MRVLVIGHGISGKAAGEFLTKRGDSVVAVDKNEDLTSFPYPVFSETADFGPFDFDLAVVSPGISLTHPICKRVVDSGIELIGEAELAFQEMKKRGNLVIGVTGSNGKSTTVTQIAHVLQFVGRRCRLLGNIGTPLVSSLEDLEDSEIVVAEISSFQLETMRTEVFFASAVLNITPNHLDRHGNMEEYRRVKLHIGALTKNKNFFFVDSRVEVEGEHTPLNIDETGNALFSRKLVETLGVETGDFIEAMKSFVPLRHRVQFVKDVGGVLCYNDSKATSVDAVRHAVEMLGNGIVLLAGGKEKGTGFLLWREIFPERVKYAILFGEAKESIAKDIGDLIPCILVNNLKEAIEKGLKLADPSDKLLLSPGCSSYDQFHNFEERGEFFIQEIENESKRYHFSSSSH